MAHCNRTLLALAAVLCAVSYWTLAAGQLPATGNPDAPVSDVCLGCICEAVSGCNRTLGCNGDVCGLFRITWAYWADAGKPIIPQDDPNRDGAYVRCVTEPYCAARTVQGYMAKFGQDCNGDQRIDCFDFAAIHRLGGYGCSGALDYNYQSRYMLCQQQVAQLGIGQ